MSEDRKLPGRASSQVSIYDYPEHLNPFYEDENHKRLRFWKINSSSKGTNQKSGRSNSFSLSGLRDIWAFKSFKLKKKSSTLGINKTSESPPELRRVYPVADTYNTVDSRSRHTYDIGLGNNFQRTAGYRSSLQNVHSTGDSNGFYRNDRYRSTIQNGNQTLATTSPHRDRYVYSGSITPTPRTRYVTPQSRYGSSQTSINSTNPFDEDDTISRCESVDGVSLRKRKKRKAPQPPVTCPTVSANQQACTTVEEASGKEDIGDISNLTAEIETFVRTHDNDQEKLQENHEKSPRKKKDKSPPIPPARTTSHTAAVKSETSDSDTVIYNQTTVTIEQVPVQTVTNDVHNHSVEVQPNMTTKIAENEKITSNKTIEEKTEHRKLHNSRESPENNADYPERTSQTPDIDNAKIRKANSEKQLNVNGNGEGGTIQEIAMQSPPRIIVRKPTEDWEYDEEIRLNGDANHVHCEESPITPISSEVEFILEHNNTPSTSPPSTSPSPGTQTRDVDVVVVKTTQQEVSSSLNDPKENPKISPSTSSSTSTQAREVELVVVKTVQSEVPSSSNNSKEKRNISSSLSQSSSTQVRDAEVIVVESELHKVSSPSKDPKEKPKLSTKKNFENSSENSSTKSHESILQSTSDDVPELKIVESTDDLTNAPTISQSSSDRYKIRFVALKNFSPEPERRDVELSPHNTQEFDVEDIDLPPAPPQRRRSVKDIIASINKSQSLLKINQPPNGNADTKRSYNYETFLPQTLPTAATEPPQPLPKSSNESINRKYSELEESERKMRKMITEMEQSSIDVPIPVVEKFDEFNADDDGSSDVFKKCVVRRDKSLQSGASQDGNRSSVEWNPLPKPRRSRNLTHELENGKI